MTTVLLGGRIYSPSHPDATAMAVRDGVIAWLGSDDVARTQYPDAGIVDLDGAFVAPAFVDSHVHVTATGLLCSGLDLRSAESKDHLLALLAAHAASSDDAVIWGQGWDQTGWPAAAIPSTDELDRVLGDRPAYLLRADMHSALASTGLRRRTPDLPAAHGYDDRGALTSEAHHLVRGVARALLNPAQRTAARVAALDAFAAAGVVSVHECAGPDIGGLDDWDELRALPHGVEVAGYWGEPVDSAEQARALIEATGARGLGGDLFVDGALGSRTAWLRSDYTDEPNCRGRQYLDADVIEAHLAACTGAGVAAGFHVIGDAAVGTVVDALERVVERLGVPAVARCGHRLEHVEMVDADQAAALGRYGVAASVQPSFDALWGGQSGMYAQRLGSDRAAALNPLALLASQGVPLAFGSDSPVTGIDPWATLRAAVNHHTPGSGMSARAAFSAATRGAWRAGGHRDGITGTLVAGAPASYAIWDAEHLEVAAPADSVQRWSTDPRSGVPPLPALGPNDPSPRCLQTVHRGTVLYGGADD